MRIGGDRIQNTDAKELCKVYLCLNWRLVRTATDDRDIRNATLQCEILEDKDGKGKGKYRIRTRLSLTIKVVVETSL